MDDMIAEQLRLEEDARDQGAHRFLTSVSRNIEAGREQGNFYGSKVLARVIKPLTQAIEKERENLAKGRAGNRSVFMKLLNGFPADIAAYFTARAVVSRLVASASLTSCAREIADNIQAEIMLRDFEDEHPALVAYLHKKHSGATERHKMVAMRHAYNSAMEDPARRWPMNDRIHLGVKLIHLLIESTGIVRMAQRKDGKNKTVNVLVGEPSLLDWITNATDAAALTAPMLYPMVAPPRPWTSPYDGGYLSIQPKACTLVRRIGPRMTQELDAIVDEMEGVYTALNNAQSVAWQVNRPVLDVMLTLWEGKQEIAGLPMGEPLPLPYSPLDPTLRHEDMTDAQRERLREWKTEASKVHEKNAKMMGKRIGSAQTIVVADQFKEYEAIYFPHNFDFRGRLYSIPTGLSPQGSDVSKGLLRFAKGKPIGDGTGPGWLAIHGANVWGEDKVSFVDRIEWVEQNEERILSCARSPLNDLWWTEADKPFCFLAFCFEWLGYCMDGADHVTHLPVALDGSCSGLQHYSAMLRDPVGGAAVNLVPHDAPADVYGVVAERSIEMLKLRVLAGNEPELSQAIIDFGIDRKATKRPTMTLPYGSTRLSCMKYVREWMDEKSEELGEGNPLWGQEKEATKLLSGIVWDAIGDTVYAARVAMDWLRKVASITAKEEMPLTWTTPDGFVVNQQYRQVKDRRVKTRMGDTLVYVSNHEELDSLDRRRQSNGFPPNYVHSMDATHLRMTTVDAFTNGIESIALIHDSFGALACEADILSAVLRETMIELYSEDRLKEIREQVSAYLPTCEMIPPAPAMGSLDINLIRDADFTFA